jgi:hypothetical protein
MQVNRQITLIKFDFIVFNVNNWDLEIFEFAQRF